MEFVKCSGLLGEPGLDICEHLQMPHLVSIGYEHIPRDATRRFPSLR